MTLYQDKYRIESARLKDWDYASRSWYFVTICSLGRAPIFGKMVESEMRLSAIGEIAESELEGLSGHYNNVVVDSYVVMPNHVHAIIMIDGEHDFSPGAQMSFRSARRPTFESPKSGSLSVIIRSYKAGVSRRCRELGLMTTIWQPRFHDHLLRGDNVISAVREYIDKNPSNWGDDKENLRRHP